MINIDDLYDFAEKTANYTIKQCKKCTKDNEKLAVLIKNEIKLNQELARKNGSYIELNTFYNFIIYALQQYLIKNHLIKLN